MGVDLADLGLFTIQILNISIHMSTVKSGKYYLYNIFTFNIIKGTQDPAVSRVLKFTNTIFTKYQYCRPFIKGLFIY